jgi:transcriptional regulator with XRE-family HTH domain
MVKKVDFGAYMYQLRTEHQLSQKAVADKLGIDISLLSKIEHGDRQVQSHMLKGIAEVFHLEFRRVQIEFLNSRIEKAFGEEPFFIESLEHYLNLNK